jgi:GNAT superfamily N-acetyltransferase
VRSRDVHLNLAQSSRQLYGFDPGAKVDNGPGWLFGAGRSTHPVISNLALRLDDDLEAGEFLAAADSFFAALGRGYALWLRGEVPADRGLAEGARAAGLVQVYEMPEMVLERRPEMRPAPPGVELRRVHSAEDAADYWRVAAAAYASIGFPPEIFSFYDDHSGFAADNLSAFLACVDGRPAGIAMTIVTHGVAGIYWVGSTEEARRRGVGRAVTAAAVDAGFELGAEVASLQASPMGEPLYRQMGFETIFSYRLLAASPR